MNGLGIEGVSLEFPYDLVVYVFNFLSAVPLSISLTSAILVALIWVLNEVTSLLLFWRALMVTVWGILVLSLFIPLGTLTSGQLWACTLLMIGVGIIVTRLTRRLRRVKVKCPNCGASFKPE